MVWGAVIGAAVGIGSSLFGASQANSQARAQQRNQMAQAREQYKFNLEEYNLANKQALLQWDWDIARTNQLREVEAQKALDQANYGSMVIRNAGINLEINQQALADRFVTEEQLRGLQVGMEYGYNQDRARSDYTYQTTTLGIDQLEQTRQYLNQVDQLANQSRSTIKRYENDTADLMSSLTLDEARDNLGYQLQQITAMETDGRMAAVTSAQQGGGLTSQRMSILAAQAAGRTYAELDMKATGRDLKVAMVNTTMRDSVNGQIAGLALQAQDQIARGDYTMNRAERDFGQATSSFQRDSDYQTSILRDLTIPTFGLAQRQYGRELQALQIQTDGRLYEATQPYREQPFLDPLRPTPGVRPRLTTVGTALGGTSVLGSVGNAILGGVSAANTFHQAETGRNLFGDLFGRSGGGGGSSDLGNWGGGFSFDAAAMSNLGGSMLGSTGSAGTSFYGG